MRTPLIRPGEGTDGIARIYHQHEKERNEMLRMIGTATAQEEEQERRKRNIGARSPAGDEQRLRAIPVSVEGVAGVIPGTNPLQAVIRKFSRQHWRTGD